MKDTMRVRVYNVLFGDAILVSVPEKAGRKVVTRNILIDVGNVLGGSGGIDTVFKPVVEDVQKVLDGCSLDLYIMTHEHMDHVQGLCFASTKHQLNLDVEYAWLTASSERGYYDRYPEARKQLEVLRAAYLDIERFLTAALAQRSPLIEALMINNDPRNTAQCVDYLRNLAKKTFYVHRGYDLRGTHPFREVEFEILGPEQDTTSYYGRFRPLSLGVIESSGTRGKPSLLGLAPPPGVDAGAFFDLVESRRSGYADILLAIDRAANNTSIVFTLEWRGWRLLFPGDAELRSWKMIKNNVGKLKPVHFLKIGHHGSKNGTPPEDLLEEILPTTPPDHRPRSAVVCTCEGSYSGVPHKETLDVLRRRCTVHSVETLAPGEHLDITFPG